MALTAPTSSSELKSAKAHPILYVVAAGSILAVALVAARALILRTDFSDLDLVQASRLLLVGSREDLLLAAILTGVAVALCSVLGSRGAKWIARIFGGVCVALVVWGVANIETVRLLGEPVTIDWIRYADFLDNINAIDSALYSVTTVTLLVAVVIVIAYGAGTYLLARSLSTSFRSIGGIVPAVAGALVFASLTVRSEAQTELPFGRTSNPLLALLGSLVAPEHRDFGLAPSPQSSVAAFKPGEGAAFEPPRLAASRGKIKNVVFFVLESAPSEYVQGFGGAYPVTPTLLRYQQDAVRFERAYAHTPASNYSMLSLFGSFYPDLSSRSMTEQYPGLRVPTIAKVLSASGYRTGFFSSSDNRFQRLDEFLSSNGVDTVKDYHDWPCETSIFRHSTEEWKYVDTSNDLCTVKPLTDWIGEDPSRPFFVTFWTGMTHYPYFTAGPVRNYVTDPNLNRYLNALHTADTAFARLMEYLESRQLLSSTLIVVLGDHGEAFGQHGTFVHATSLYEENIHVPLMFINPEAFAGEVSQSVAGLIDIAPTVLDILAIDPPASWQGRSLFAPGRSDVVFFFTPWNGFQLGLRHGSMKLIYDSSREEQVLFDLAADPRETRDLSEHPEARAERVGMNEMLAAWVPSQREYIQEMLAGWAEEGAAAAVGDDVPPPADLAPFAIPFAIDAPHRARAYEEILPGFWIGFDEARGSVIKVRQKLNAGLPAVPSYHRYTVEVRLEDLKGSEWATVERTLATLGQQEKTRLGVTLVGRLSEASQVRVELFVPQRDAKDRRILLGEPSLGTALSSHYFGAEIEAAGLGNVDPARAPRVVLLLPLKNGLVAEIAALTIHGNGWGGEL